MVCRILCSNYVLREKTLLVTWNSGISEAKEPPSHSMQAATKVMLQWHIHLFLPPLLHHWDWKWARRVRRKTAFSPPLPSSCVPPSPPQASDLREKREEVTGNTGSRQPYLKPSCVLGSHRREGDRAHMDKEAASAHAYLKCTFTAVRAHWRLIFSLDYRRHGNIQSKRTLSSGLAVE